MITITAGEYPHTHAALSCLFEDNVPFTTPQQFYLRDCWMLGRLELFLGRLSTDGGLDSELWRFVSPGDDAKVRPALDYPDGADYAERMLNSCFDGEDSDTWWRQGEVGFHAIY